MLSLDKVFNAQTVLKNIVRETKLVRAYGLAPDTCKVIPYSCGKRSSNNLALLRFLWYNIKKIKWVEHGNQSNRRKMPKGRCRIFDR